MTGGVDHQGAGLRVARGGHARIAGTQRLSTIRVQRLQQGQRPAANAGERGRATVVALGLGGDLGQHGAHSILQLAVHGRESLVYGGEKFRRVAQGQVVLGGAGGGDSLQRDLPAHILRQMGRSDGRLGAEEREPLLLRRLPDGGRHQRVLTVLQHPVHQEVVGPRGIGANGGGDLRLRQPGDRLLKLLLADESPYRIVFGIALKILLGALCRGVSLLRPIVNLLEQGSVVPQRLVGDCFQLVAGDGELLARRDQLRQSAGGLPGLLE